MPLPWLLLGGIAALTGANAKKKSEKAQQIADNAQELYNITKLSLELSRKKTENALVGLTQAKMHVLNTSIPTFLRGYNRIKHIKLSESSGLNELSKFNITEKDVVSILHTIDKFNSVSSGNMLTTSIGGAAIAMSLGMTLTSFSTVFAPILLIKGISSSIKAQENLEKANVYSAEVELAVEKMKTSITLCDGISKKADMFSELINELDSLFSKCAILLDNVTASKQSFFKKTLKPEDITQEEYNLIAVTRSLAGAIKAIIDTPILNPDGEISIESTKAYEDTSKMLPVYEDKATQIDQADFEIDPGVAEKNLLIAAKVEKKNVNKQNKRNKQNKTINTDAKDVIRNVLAILLGIATAYIFSSSVFDMFLFFTIPALAVINHNSEITVFQLLKKCLSFSLAVEFTVMFFTVCTSAVYIDHYILKSIGIGIISLVLFFVFYSTESQVNSLKSTISKICCGILLSCIGILLYAFIRFLGLDVLVVRILLYAVYFVFAFISICVI